MQTHKRKSRYSNINLICPKYKHELEDDRSFTVTVLGCGIFYTEIREAKTESFRSH